MKKNFIIYAILLVVVGVIVGMVSFNIGLNRKSINTDNDINSKDESNYIIVENNNYPVKKEWKCDEISLLEIKDMMFEFEEKYFITNSGDLYEYSENNLFSNGKNYLKIETDIKFERFFNNYSVISAEGNIYRIKNNDIEEFDYFQLKKSIEDGCDYKIEKLDNLISYQPNDYIYINEKSINAIEYDYNNFKYIDKGTIGIIPEQEEILKINISLNEIFVKTDKNYYKIRKYKQYADSEEKFQLEKDEIESNNYQEIQFCNAHILVDKNDAQHYYLKYNN